MSLLAAITKEGEAMPGLFLISIITFSLCALASELPVEVSSVWDDVRLDMREISGVENTHLIQADSSATFVCFWEEKKSSDLRCIKALRFSSDGTVLGAEKEIVQFPDKKAIANVYGSGNGNYLLLLAEKHYSHIDIKARRLLADLSFRESDFIPVCETNDTIHPIEGYLKGTIDNNDLVVIALNEDDGSDDQKWTLGRVRLFYLNRNGLADSLTFSTDDDKKQYMTLGYCVGSEGCKITLLFDSEKWDNINKQAIYSRVLSYSSNTLEWKTGYNKIMEYENDIARPVILTITGKYDYPGGIAIGQMPFSQPMLIYLDSTGQMNEEFSEELPSYLDFFSIGSGFNGTYGFIASTLTSDSTWIYWTDKKSDFIPPHHPEQPLIIKGGAPAGICLDILNKPVVSWTRGKSVYLGHFLGNNFSFGRLNGIEDKAVMSKCALSYSGRNRVVGWRINGVDSIYLCGWTGRERNNSDETRNWFSQIYSDSGAFPIKLSGDTAMMVYNNTDNLKIQIWNIKNNINIKNTGINDNGSKGCNPSFTIDSSRVAVVWEDRRTTHGDTSYIYFQAFDRDGNPVGSNIALSAGKKPSIQQMDIDRYLVTFNYSTQITTNIGGVPVVKTVSYVYGMIVNKNGSINGEVIRLNPQNNGGSNAKIASFYETGKYLVVWLESSVNMTSQRLYGCVIDNSGKIEKSSFPITTDSSITDFDLCRIDSYGALLSWHDKSHGQIKAVMLNYSGIPIVDQWTVSNRVIDTDIPVSLSVSSSDSVGFISWIDRSNFGKSYTQVTGEYVVISNKSQTKILSSQHRKKTTEVIPTIGNNSGMELYTLTGRKVSETSLVKQRPYGVYLKRMPDGKIMAHVNCYKPKKLR